MGARIVLLIYTLAALTRHRVIALAPEPRSALRTPKKFLPRSALLPLLAVGAAALPLRAGAGVGDVLAAAGRANEITYSQIGKNLQRMQRGDNSMGSVQSSTSPRALRRRAAMACRSRKVLDAAGIPDEKTCTIGVLDGGEGKILAVLEGLGDACAVDATRVCI